MINGRVNAWRIINEGEGFVENDLANFLRARREHDTRKLSFSLSFSGEYSRAAKLSIFSILPFSSDDKFQLADARAHVCTGEINHAALLGAFNKHRT